MEYQEAYVNLNMLITNEPAYSTVYAQILEHCKDELWEDEAAAFAQSLITAKNQLQSGASLVNVLVRRGGLNRTIFVNGELYEGSLEQLQSDESVPADALIEIGVVSTEAGIDIAQAFREANSLDSLFNELPQFVDGFKLVLQKCAEKPCSTKELQAACQEAGIIAQGYAQAQELHASYFTNKLERYGALNWNGDYWETTPKGASAL